MKELKIEINSLPILLKVLYNGNIKEYVIKATKDKKGIFLNKKEY